MQYGYCGAALVVISAVLLVLTIWVLAKNPGASADRIICRGRFNHGVASGDPQAIGIVLWTRLTPSEGSSGEELPVHWKVWLDDGTFGSEDRPIVSGDALARPQRDFTVKVDVQSVHLKPKVNYAFRFYHESESSPIGKFHLPPAESEVLDTLKYAIFSCSNWRWGYFNAYGVAASEKLDFWLHVGDFIYEHGEDAFPTEASAVRNMLVPQHETVSLEDYRKRYALYRSDPDLQSISAAAPLVSIWDDHEIANDAWKDGAGGHDSRSDGDYVSRKVAATQAYHEWMPTRPHKDPWQSDASDAPWMHWRELAFGDLASLLVLETRHTSRTDSSTMTRGWIYDKISKILESAGDPPIDKWPGSNLEASLQSLKADVDAESRRKEKTILGQEQLDWIEKKMRLSVDSGIRWRLIAQPLVAQERMSADYEGAIAKAEASRNSEIVTKWKSAIRNVTVQSDVASKRMVAVHMAAGRYKINLSFDDWMAYIADRNRLAASLRVGSATGNLIYGGDTHNAWAGVLRDSMGEIVATEFDGMSVSSGGLEQYPPYLPSDLKAAAWEAANADLLWADTHSRGFMLVNLGRDVQHVEYRGVNVRNANDRKSWCLAAFDVSRVKPIAPRRTSCSAGSNHKIDSSALHALAPTPSVVSHFLQNHTQTLRHRSQIALRLGAPRALSA